jgi:TolB-like protein/Tfp pilus assembly protein PilF
MRPSEPDVDDAVRAVLDGTSVDWTGLETSEDLETRSLSEQLKVLSAIGAVHRAEAPETRWGHLRLLEKVGAGAFGQVYRAWDTRLDREVALKLLPATAGDSGSPVIEEGRLLARVRHPNVVTIYGAELIDGQIGLWMEFVRGRTLEALLRSGHQFSLDDVLAIGRELCRAVTAVHAAGLVHRDIKAQNVMRADDGRVVLMDFGAGRDVLDAGPTRTGTPLYLAPELFAGQPATVRSDVYSIGVLIYRLLTGGYPVTGRSIHDLRRAHEQEERVGLTSVRPDLPPRLASVIERATAATPAERYPSCDALAEELNAINAPRQPRRPTLGLVAAAIAVLAIWAGWEWLARSSARATSSTAAGVAFAPAERPIIVVKPFRNHRGDADSEFLVDGLTYELIRNLAVIDGIDVRSAASSFALKGKEITLAAIGQQLGVNLVLEGSVSGSGEQVRVQAQFAQVGGDTPIWVGKFDRRVTDMLAIQDEIARAVVNQLRLTLGRGQRLYNLDSEASTLYLKARTLVERRGTPSAEAAVPLFEQIIARDPSFAPAYAGLADAYAFMSQDLPDVLGLPHQQALTLMRTAAERAIALDPLLPEAHAALGLLHSREFAWQDAEQAFERAIALNPSLTHAYTSYVLTTLVPLGRFDEADTLLQEARRRDPLSLSVKREQAALEILRNNPTEAVRLLEDILAVDPGFTYVTLLLARAQSLAGRIDDAMPYWNSVSGRVGSQHWMAYAFVRAGRRAEIERLMAQPQVAYRQVLFHAALDDVDGAIEALERAADEAPHRTVRLIQYPELEAVRRDARFQTIRARFNLP